MTDLDSLRDFWQEADPPLPERKARLREFWDMSRPPDRWITGAPVADVGWNDIRSFEARLSKFLEGAPALLRASTRYPLSMHAR